MLRGLLLLFLFFLATPVFADVYINEIMYDLDGTDSGREWVEVYNDGSDSVDLSTWKLFENGSKHGLIPLGAGTLSGGSYAIIADNANTFKTDWPSFSGLLFDSAFSLSNTGESLALVNTNGDVVGNISYTSDMGASGDGNSLQYNGGSWISGTPTPGGKNVEQASTPDSETSTSSSTVSGGSSGKVTSVSKDRNILSLDIVPNKKQVIAGDRIQFFGEAFAGDMRFPAEAKYSWNFGDGTTGAGQTVSHTYYYTGAYSVSLEASSVLGTVHEALAISVVTEPLILSLVDSSIGTTLKITNNASTDVDISMWSVQDATSTFAIPNRTHILAKSSVFFDKRILGFSPTQNSEILFPDGTVAVSLEKPKTQTPTIVKSVNKVVQTTQPNIVSVAPVEAPTVEEQSLVSALDLTAQAGETQKNNGMSLWLGMLALVVGAPALTLAVWSAKRGKQGSMSNSFEIIEDNE